MNQRVRSTKWVQFAAILLTIAGTAFPESIALVVLGRRSRISVIFRKSRRRSCLARSRVLSLESRVSRPLALVFLSDVSSGGYYLVNEQPDGPTAPG